MFQTLKAGLSPWVCCNGCFKFSASVCFLVRTAILFHLSDSELLMHRLYYLSS